MYETTPVGVPNQVYVHPQNDNFGRVRQVCMCETTPFRERIQCASTIRLCGLLAGHELMLANKCWGLRRGGTLLQGYVTQKKHPLLGPYSRTIHKAVWWS
jgi:hypothetical protein